MTKMVENVFKFGSETVANEMGIDQDKVNMYAEQLSSLAGGLIVVTSGAVKIGRAEAPHITDDQVLAGLGSAGVVMAWKQAFRQHGRLAGQVLATDAEMSDPSEGSTLLTALTKDVASRVVPILNTNDKLNVAELSKRHFKGENDGPAAHIAVMMGAGCLTLMTGRNGLFDDNSKPIQSVQFDPEYHRHLLAMVESRGSKGQGIYAKLTAAINAVNGGVAVHIAGADQEIERILASETGTYFEPKPVEWRKL